jgi:hypothetical protein
MTTLSRCRIPAEASIRAEATGSGRLRELSTTPRESRRSHDEAAWGTLTATKRRTDIPERNAMESAHDHQQQ